MPISWRTSYFRLTKAVLNIHLLSAFFSILTDTKLYFILSEVNTIPESVFLSIFIRNIAIKNRVSNKKFDIRIGKDFPWLLGTTINAQVHASLRQNTSKNLLTAFTL